MGVLLFREILFSDPPQNRLNPHKKRLNYDPWGLNLAGIEVQGNSEHQYQYNGKEKQTELGLDWGDYGARMYDAQSGRWYVVDPMTDTQESWSPYHYVYNNPVRLTDPDGREPNEDPPGFLASVGSGFVGTFTSIGNAIAHPFETAQAIGQRQAAAIKVDPVGAFVDGMTDLIPITAQAKEIIQFGNAVATGIQTGDGKMACTICGQANSGRFQNPAKVGGNF